MRSNLWLPLPGTPPLPGTSMSKTARRIAFAAGLILVSVVPAPCHAFRVSAELVTTNLPSEPMFITAPVGNSDYFFTGARRNADVWIHDRNTGDRLGTFLNLPNATAFSQDGLLSLTFHPDYASNGLFYSYVYRDDEQLLRITEHKRSDTDPLLADPSYSRQIYQMPNNNSHNGGWLGFSPIDGYLYFTTGDGGANQGVNNGLPAQDLFDPHGKLHRVDVSGDDFPADPDMNFAVPADNPFAAGGGLPEIYAYGLRHPFRANFDRVTGDLYIGDVGGVQYEEINRVPAGVGGLNFGWRPLEGPDKTFDNDDPIPPNAVDPIFYYPHMGGASVIGGAVYRGSEFPDMQGTYFHTDWVRGTISSFDVQNGTPIFHRDRTEDLFPGGKRGLLSVSEDGLGELYFVDSFASDLYRLVQEPVTPLVGDYNEDEVVDLADYTLWRDNVGAPAGTLPNDPNSSVIGSDQYLTWVAQFGQSVGATSTIPEPAGWLLLAMAACAACRRGPTFP